MRLLARLSGFLLPTALLVAALLYDRLAAPTELTAVVYAVPLLAAAQCLSPRAVAAFGLVVLALAVLSAATIDLLLRQVAFRLLFLAVVAVQSYLVANSLTQMRRAQQAERAARATQQQLQNFLALVAHDLRGPLTVIRGYLQLARRADARADAREQAWVHIDAAGQRMDRMVRDLVDAARLGAGAFTVQPQRMDLVALAREVQEVRRAGAPEHQLVLETPQHLEGVWDRDRLLQVLDNLVANAIKYSSEGGQIVVRIQQQRDQVVVRVIDQGMGLRLEELPLLFQPFTRLYTEQQTHGAGLGLYICKGIIEAHGGRIWAESSGPGRGSTFAFTLPLAPVGAK